MSVFWDWVLPIGAPVVAFVFGPPWLRRYLAVAAGVIALVVVCGVGLAVLLHS